ncbi:Leucine-rich_repeat [Hexamita inflata]|uniref:Leucine-rich repeat n=1 Tax=Hexamita inflata TaxID=28002 RepID=A0AA86QVC6_9EUKA|nr:Leucine-rich repeat [Hexamita inflata]CAI9966734.1 Leucine-rich repeat [Hexamita inflata]
MKKLDFLSVEDNLISDFTQLEQLPNFNKIYMGYRCFDISNQRQPSLEELSNSNNLRKIEQQNTSLVLIQNKRKTIKTSLNNVKRKINAVMNRIHSNNYQFSSSAVHLFQQLNEAVSQ